jgi:ABC-type proline/glycine betaine transport system permease subunit
MALPALFFLILTPFALILEQDLVAENLAIYAYYFLIMATIMGIREVRQEDKEKPEN